MDNFSQEIDDEKEIESLSPTSEFKKQDVESIIFEENVDIDEIQKKLQEVIESSEGEPEVEMSLQDLDEEDDTEQSDGIVFSQYDNSEISVPVINQQSVDSVVNSKKYVVYIDPQNIDFMESLSLNERKEIINKILREQNAAIAKLKKAEQKSRFYKHMIIAVLTFIIGFPILFSIVNNATILTIKNYQQASDNFVRLYKEKGKVKSINSGSVDSFKY